MTQTVRQSFDDRVAASLGQMAPAEQRLARFIAGQKERAVLGSAAQIAELAGVSDATVVRTARAMGYETLAALREDLLQDLTGAASPAGLLARTLDETGSDPAQVLTHVVDLHDQVLAVLRRPDFATVFARAVEVVASGRTRHVFGIGPSGAIAEYAALQLNRIGLRSHAMAVSGVAFADRLIWIDTDDVVIAFGYAPMYRELRLLFDRAADCGAKVVLISDSLGPIVADRVAVVLPVPRGRADHLAMHGGTMVLVEALILGLAARDPDRALTALDLLSTLRGTIDAEWRKRGTRKPQTADPPPSSR